jgi:uncharacterized SAM-binding protein YcdF (DUF218 family)
MNWLLTNIISAILLPPTSLLLVLIAGLLLLQKNRRWAMTMLATGIIALWLLATPLASKILLQSLERNITPVNIETVGIGSINVEPRPQAIVVLGAGRYSNAPEYGGDTISGLALERVRYAALLAHRTGIPVLTSGGRPDSANAPEGAMMRSILESEFNTPVRWVETRSNNSADEARECWAILAPQHIRKIYLVTHAWHMPRAKMVFEKVGFEVIAAPTGFTTQAPFSLLQLIPDSRALNLSRTALHEWMGLFWYRLT